MRKIIALAALLGVLVCIPVATDAAQKKKNTAKPAPAKETPYQYCKRMISKDIGAAARLHHVVVSPSGKITCWYYG